MDKPFENRKCLLFAGYINSDKISVSSLKEYIQSLSDDKDKINNTNIYEYAFLVYENIDKSADKFVKMQNAINEKQIGYE